jgi:hypothetical protein
MAKCDLCKREMQTAFGCITRRVKIKGKNGVWRCFSPVKASADCGDCNVKQGKIHHPGCDQERCPSCGGQLISCDCEMEGD